MKFIVGHTDRWRDYRDQNYADKWDRYERIFRGIWEEADKERGSERSRLISPATQQAIETRHAEIMEAIFGQGEFFDIEDDLADKNGSLDIEKLKSNSTRTSGRTKSAKVSTRSRSWARFTAPESVKSWSRRRSSRIRCRFRLM